MATSYPQYYDVFISHRGPELKATFATDLYRSITAKGLQVFLDKPEMQVGEEIPAQIEAAIKAASVHIAIFSPGYAESKWCLDELLSMVKSGKTIIPVFYNVKPEHLRWTEWTGTEKDGPYAKALRTHEDKKRHGTQTIHEWRKVLSAVANISGLELDNGDTEELLRKVVDKVLLKCPPPLDVAKYPTGLKEKLKELESKVLSEHQSSLHSLGAKVVGIWGLGGIGKTTLARYFYKLKRSEYEMSSIVFDVKDNAAERRLNFLQSKLIKDLKHREIEIARWEEGKEILKNHLSYCHALVILDDVDHADQLDAFLPIKDVLNSRSLILVTTRDRGVLESAGIELSVYELRGLNESYSRELFCSYAFSQRDPLPEFGKLVDGFIEACHGLPLSLKVLGALLCGKNDIPYWEELLDGLNKLPADIESSLRSSYNSLNVEEEQQIFLDIACFCIGEDRDRWIRIWHGSGWSGTVGFRNLQSKCLVEVDSGNRIRMHDHLRDMGRNIACSPESMSRRLWYHINNFQDIKEQLEQSSTESTEVRGIRLTNYHIGRSTGDIQGSSSEWLRLKKWLLLNCKWVITQVLGLRMTNYNIQGSIGDIQRSSPEVWRLKNLQLLEAGGNDVESIVTRVQSPKLIWLRWFNCNYDLLPSSIPMHDLTVFEVYSQTLKRLWTSKSPVPAQLMELIICAPLVKFPKSLGQLKWLEKLEAKCKNLTTLPKDFCLPNLKYLTIGSDKLERLWQSDSQAPLQLRELIIYAPLVEFPKSLELKYLEKLVARNTSIATLPEKFYLPSLKYLELRSNKLQRLWQSESQAPLQLRALILYAPHVEFPKSLPQLKHLELVAAIGLSLTPDFCYLPFLKYLLLKQFELKILPGFEGVITEVPKGLEGVITKVSTYHNSVKWREEWSVLDNSDCMFEDSICSVAHLRRIKLDCHSLEVLPNFLGNLTGLQHVDLAGCESLKTLPDSLGNFKNLQHVNLTKCKTLKTLPDSFVNLSNLRHLDLAWCCGLESLPESLGNLTTLLHINLQFCESLKTLPNSCRKLTKLQHINLSHCKNLKISPNTFVNLTAPISIDVSLYRSLEIHPNSFGNLSQLEHLHLEGCSSLTISRETLGNMTKLKCLDLSFCLHEELLPAEIGCLQSLKKLNLLGTNLKELPCDLVSLSNLEVLRVGSHVLEELPPSLGCLTNLKKLWLCDSNKLQCLPDSVELLSQLTELKIWNCGIQYLPPAVMKMNNLKVLGIYKCPLRELPFKRLSLELSSGLFQLQKLDLYCTEVLEVSFPQGVCPNLRHLRVICCEHLVEVGALPTTLKELDLAGCAALREIKGVHGFSNLETLDMSHRHIINMGVRHYGAMDSSHYLPPISLSESTLGAMESPCLVSPMALSQSTPGWYHFMFPWQGWVWTSRDDSELQESVWNESFCDSLDTKNYDSQKSGGGDDSESEEVMSHHGEESEGVDDSEEEEVMLHHVNETEGYHGEESNGGDEEGDDWKEAEAEVMPYHCEESEERDDS